MPRWTTADRQGMQLALDLARRGQGFVEPNPMVGCVIVQHNRIVGRGRHKKFGGPHAEPNALRAAGYEARGATVYVTLEPCCHTGKTPPCTDALIRARVGRLVVAMKDPNPLVAGKGIRKLRAAGIEVDVGLLRAEAVTLNIPFIKYHAENLPYVILKWAQSIDGKIATRRGESKWITSRQSRTAAHALRARVDAVIVGVGTVLVDDPDLTARLVKPRRTAARIILDTNLRTPLYAKLVRTARKTPTIIVTGHTKSLPHKCGTYCGTGVSPVVHHGRDARATGGFGISSESENRNPKSAKVKRLERAGCKVLEIRCGRSGIHPATLLRRLRDMNMTNILVEGGGRVLGAFLQRHLADEAHIFVAPRLIGGEAAPGPLRDIGPASMRNLPKTILRSITHLGPDLCYNLGFD